MFNVNERSGNYVSENDNSPLEPSQNTSNQNFEVAILFNAIEKSGNYIFEDDSPPPTALRARVVSYALGAV